jgi:hypothetical protein
MTGTSKILKTLMAVTVAVIVMAAGVGAQTGGYYCDISLSRCPSEYDGKTLTVPLDVVALSARFQACVDTALSASAKPISMTVISARDTSNLVDSYDVFGYNRILPVDTGAGPVPVTMDIKYDVVVDTQMQNSQGVMIDSTYRYVKTIMYSFFIRRTAIPPQNWGQTQGLIQTCGGKPGISLYWQGKEIDKVTGNMTDLTLRFTKSNFFAYDKNNVTIEIKTKDGTKQDSLSTKSISSNKTREDATTIEWDFVREYVTSDAGVIRGNDKLEHNTIKDSIVFIFRNLIIPLDTFKLVVPYDVDGVISVLTPNRNVPQVKPNTEKVTVVAPVVQLTGEFTAGPNPQSKKSGIVNFYRQGKRVGNSELRIYDVTGNVINKVKIKDNAIGTQARRKVGTSNLCYKNGRTVPEGTYVVKGVIKTSDGKSENVSVILSVR